MMKSRQHGVTVIETVGALAIGTIMMVGLTQMIDTSLEDMEGQHAAHYQSQVTAAARKYIKENYAALLTSTAAGAVVPVSIDQLKGANFLPSAFATTNAYQHSTCLLVRQPPGTSGKLDALVVTSGGTPIEDRHIALVAASSGIGGGYISAANFATAQGGSWSSLTTDFINVTCPGGASAALTGTAADGGHLASHIYYDGQLGADYLYRQEVPNRPELNSMFTPIRMAGKAVVKRGDPCGAQTAVALDETERLVTCTADSANVRRWLPSFESSWKDPVATYAALPVTDKTGDVRIALDTKRAFVYDSAAAKWIALAVDELGNFTVPENLTVSNGSLSVERRSITAAENITAGWEIKGKHVIATQYLEGPNVNFAKRSKNGDLCHIETYNEKGELSHINPIGTVAIDQDYRTIVCDENKTFKYADAIGR